MQIIHILLQIVFVLNLDNYYNKIQYVVIDLLLCLFVSLLFSSLHLPHQYSNLIKNKWVEKRILVDLVLKQ